MFQPDLTENLFGLQQFAHRRNKNSVWRDVFTHYRVSPDSGMFADLNRTDDLYASADVDMPANCGNAFFGRPDRNLLEDQAVAANFRVGMNHDAVRMGNEEAAADRCVYRDVRTRDD